jgi:hypothetical protein
VVDATVDAADRATALARVQQQVAGVVVSFEEAVPSRMRSGKAPPPVPTARRPRMRYGRIKPKDITTYFRQMAVSVNAGMPLREAMESILEDLDHAKLRTVLQRVTRSPARRRNLFPGPERGRNCFPAPESGLDAHGRGVRYHGQDPGRPGHHVGKSGRPEPQDQQHHGLSHVCGGFLCHHHERDDLLHFAPVPGHFRRLGSETAHAHPGGFCLQ